MKNWLDKYEYGGEAGYTDIPFDYNSAWGGQFEDGGNIPTAQDGLWSTNKKAYVDSTLNANKNLDFVKRLYDSKLSIPTPRNIEGWKPGQRSTHLMSYDPESKRVYPEVVNINGKLQYLPGDRAWDYADQTGEFIQFPTSEQAEWFANSTSPASGYKMGTNVLSGIDPKTGKPYIQKHAMGGSLPGSVGFTYARTQGAAPSNGPYAKKTKASAENGMTYYQHGLDWKPKTISKNGSVIEDDRGQWAHPGKITKINSNKITMKGVDYPVFGISDTGDKKMMYPEQEYTFKGKNVTEIPMAQKGKTLPPMYTDDPRKVQAYEDSLNLYQEGIIHEDFLRDHGFLYHTTHEFPFSKVTSYGYATKPKDKIKIQPISAVSQETNPSHPDYYRAEWLKYKKPIQPYILQQKSKSNKTIPLKPFTGIIEQPEPKLKKKVSNINKISVTDSFTPGVTSIQHPDIEIPNIPTGKYKVSYWDPEIKDWNERGFTTKEESDKFFNEAPTYYQTKQYVEKKSTGGWLEKYN